jgi:alkanesulfonate monooxygenase SsuD/methylene tetrahydromethanopterin reductase-like flavin-dependent oxidoreductase (luciferase family)
MVGISIRYDLRRAPEGAPYPALYRACLEQACWADRLGLDAVVLSEHHATEDGYLPSPLVVAGAVAAVTERIAISISALVAPLWDPIRLAEDLATLDLLARGRVSAVLVIGYRPVEFDVLGFDYSQRAERLVEVVGVLRRAWTGEPFEHRGHLVQVLPTPVTPGGPLLLMGGSTPVAARRAARLGMGLIPSHHDPAIVDAYHAECERLGVPPVFVARPAGPAFVHVSEDPERDWARIGPLALHDARVFRSWQPGAYRTLTESRALTLDELRAEGTYQVLTPDECVALAESLPEGSSLVLHPLMGGLDPDVAAESLTLFEHRVLPRLAR